MISKRRRLAISRLLLVHGRAVCRLTYDRQRLINAFMSIRLAVQRRFKPRAAESTHHPSAHLPGRPTNQPPIQPPNERDKLPTPLPPSLSLPRVSYVRASGAAGRDLHWPLRANRHPLEDRTITLVDYVTYRSTPCRIERRRYVEPSDSSRKRVGNLFSADGFGHYI